MTCFSEKISRLFLVIDQVFLIFRIFTVLNVVYDRRKTTISEKNSLMTPFFYSVRTFASIRQHYFSKYWGERMHGPFSPPQILGGPSPQSLLGLRPCFQPFETRAPLINLVPRSQTTTQIGSYYESSNFNPRPPWGVKSM